MKDFKTGAGIAAAVATIALASLSVPASAQGYGKKEAKLEHCYGVNACKGQSDCNTAKNECKGLNECKNQGFKELTAAQCAAQGGSLTPPKK